MKKIIIAIVLLVSLTGFSQVLEPVTWSTSVKKISDSEVELIATANIEDDWHLYSQSVPENGPIPTTFTFQSNGKYLKKGNTKEEAGTTVDDKIFNMRIKYFGKKTTFKQRIKLKTKEAFKVNAVVEFMVCDDTRCLPPTEVDLTFNIE